MRRTVLLAAVLLAAGACSTPPCEKLGEQLCACTGLTTDVCKTQVQEELKGVGHDDAACDAILNSCNDHKPPESQFCTWLTTDAGKRYCGLAPP